MENNVSDIRRQKYSEYTKTRIPYPNQFKAQNSIERVINSAEGKDKEALTNANEIVSISGRIHTIRTMGKATFMTIQDTGGSIQVYISDKILQELDTHADILDYYDLGDIIYIKGLLTRTNKGELTIFTHVSQIITKCLLPIPDKHKGLQDIETKYRQRYLDLLSNEESVDVFKKRSQVMQSLRNFMLAHDFLEVETPMLHNQATGAAAKPFHTHHNALDMDMVLRISPELFLKRLTVGGFPRVFEVNRNFRNEGISTRHNPEFTMMESYMKDCDVHDLMDFVELMFKSIQNDVLPNSGGFEFDGYQIDFNKPFIRKSMSQFVLDEVPGLNLDSYDDLAAEAEKHGISVEKSWGKGRLIVELFEQLAEHKISEPTFVCDHPTEISPLSRRYDDNLEFTERFELFVAGREIANGFSELNNPEHQKASFEAQVNAKEAGDDEAMEYDHDYITALEYGLPPTAGLGVGMDRLVMLLTGKTSIRDVVLFPHMRKIQDKSQDSE